MAYKVRRSLAPPVFRLLSMRAFQRIYRVDRAATKPALEGKGCMVNYTNMSTKDHKSRLRRVERPCSHQNFWCEIRKLLGFGPLHFGLRAQKKQALHKLCLGVYPLPRGRPVLDYTIRSKVESGYNETQRLEPSGYDKRRSTKLETTRDDQTKFETTRNVPNRYKATSGVHSKSPIDTTRSRIASGHTQTIVRALPSQNSSLCLKRTRGGWRVVEVP